MDNSFKIIICGNVSNGKSTFANCLIGKKILNYGNDEITSKILRIKHVPNHNDNVLINGKIFSMSDAYLEIENINKQLSSIETINIECSTNFHNNEFENMYIYDIPGYNSSNQLKEQIHKKYDELFIDADIVFIVISETNNKKSNDNKLLVDKYKKLNKYKDKLYIIYNKIDDIEKIYEENDEINMNILNQKLNEIHEYYGVSIDNIIPVSSLYSSFRFDNEAINKVLCKISQKYRPNICKTVIDTYYNKSNMESVKSIINNIIHDIIKTHLVHMEKDLLLLYPKMINNYKTVEKCINTINETIIIKPSKIVFDKIYSYNKNAVILDSVTKEKEKLYIKKLNNDVNYQILINNQNNCDKYILHSKYKTAGGTAVGIGMATASVAVSLSSIVMPISALVTVPLMSSAPIVIDGIYGLYTESMERTNIIDKMQELEQKIRDDVNNEYNLTGQQCENDTIRYNNKIIYRGNTKCGEPHGKGRYSDEHIIIEGTFQNGVPIEGCIYWENIKYYEGGLNKYGQPHGHGTCNRCDNTTSLLKGNFDNGQIISGNLTIDNNLVKFNGSFKDNIIYDGHLSYKLNDITYVGPIKNGYLSGTCNYIINNVKLEGRMDNGRFKDGCIYDGGNKLCKILNKNEIILYDCFKDKMWRFEGSIINKNGSLYKNDKIVYNGEYEEDKFIGKIHCNNIEYEYPDCKKVQLIK